MSKDYPPKKKQTNKNKEAAAPKPTRRDARQSDPRFSIIKSQ
jgi:hypothetical protein